MTNLNAFILYFWAVFIVFLCVGIFVITTYPLILRSSKVKKISKKFNLTFEKGDVGKYLLKNETLQFNIMSGMINQVSIYFYDMNTPFWFPELLKKQLDDIKNNPHASFLEKTAYTASILAPGNLLPKDYRRSGIERISYININGKGKFVGYRFGTMNIKERSDLYASKKLITQIFDEIQKSGYSRTFDSLQSADTKSIQFITSIYVREE